jgi:hypothetical protein
VDEGQVGSVQPRLPSVFHTSIHTEENVAHERNLDGLDGRAWGFKTENRIRGTKESPVHHFSMNTNLEALGLKSFESCGMNKRVSASVSTLKGHRVDLRVNSS